MHPLLKPALRRGWRDLNTVQFGVAPAHAMVFGPLDQATGHFLTLLDGTRGLPLLRDEGRRMGLPDGRVDALIARLTEAGVLDDARGGGPAADALRARGSVVDRLRADLASGSVVAPEPGGAMRRLAARRSLRVQVRGAGRVGVTTAAILAASGVGHVDVGDGGVVEPWDVSPGGLPPGSVGERRSDAARRAVRAAAPEREPGAGEAGEETGTAGQGLSLVVLAPRDGLRAHAPDPSAAAELITTGIPHLYAGVVEATGVVGPLVLPGTTPCAGCLAQARTDLDAAWPRLMAQWCSGRQRQVVAGDTALTTAVAALAAAHALAFLDGVLPASAGARCELPAPALEWRTVPLAAHLRCPCGARQPTPPVPAAHGEAVPETSAQQTPRRHGTRQHGTHRSRRQAARDNGPVPAARGTAVRGRPGNGGAHV